MPPVTPVFIPGTPQNDQFRDSTLEAIRHIKELFDPRPLAEEIRDYITNNWIDFIGNLNNIFSEEHTKNARPSTKGTHEKGQARKKKDRGGEKGDARRPLPRKRPPGWKGPYPPK